MVVLLFYFYYFVPFSVFVRTLVPFPSNGDENMEEGLEFLGAKIVLCFPNTSNASNLSMF